MILRMIDYVSKMRQMGTGITGWKRLCRLTWARLFRVEGGVNVNWLGSSCTASQDSALDTSRVYLDQQPMLLLLLFDFNSGCTELVRSITSALTPHPTRLSAAVLPCKICSANANKKSTCRMAQTVYEDGCWESPG